MGVKDSGVPGTHGFGVKVSLHGGRTLKSEIGAHRSSDHPAPNRPVGEASEPGHKDDLREWEFHLLERYRCHIRLHPGRGRSPPPLVGLVLLQRTESEGREVDVSELHNWVLSESLLLELPRLTGSVPDVPLSLDGRTANVSGPYPSSTQEGYWYPAYQTGPESLWTEPEPGFRLTEVTVCERRNTNSLRSPGL